MNVSYRDLRKSMLKGSIFGVIAALTITMLVLLLPFTNTGLNRLQNPTDNTELDITIIPKSRPQVFSVILQSLDIQPNAPQYSLPINLSEVEYLDTIIDFLEGLGYNFSSDALDMLSRNGFIVISVPFHSRLWTLLTNFDAFYNRLYWDEIPVFITVDAVLHIYHVLYMSLLKKAESKYFVDWLNATLSSLINYMQKLYEEYTVEDTLKHAMLDVIAYLCVAKKLLEPNYDPPISVAEVVNNEVVLITNADSVTTSPLFGEPFDYTLFKPRGYYTSSELLEKYFRLMMWLGYAYFRLDDTTRTLEAILLTIALNNAKAELEDTEVRARDLWEKIYLTTAFFVGYSDDLTIYDYEEAIQMVFGTKFNLEDLKNTTKLQQVIEILKEKEKSKILVFGERISGLRLMGQRFTPDSYILQSLTDPNVPGRMFPQGLDIMAVFGSKRAETHITNDTSAYPGYAEELNKLKNEFESLSIKNWTQNLYWGWLYTIKATLKNNYSGYPTFMQTEPWLDEKLTTALSSWAELRHDTILYTKQTDSYISIVEPPKGYVEPIPEVYNRLLALCNATIDGLEKLGILTEYTEILEKFGSIVKRLLEISIKELQNEPLTESDYGFIGSFGFIVSSLLESLENAQAETTVIADVHTCYDVGGFYVLEEAVGLIDPIIVIYKDPSGRLRAALGGTFSYYEFISTSRLTDEDWRGIITSGNLPDRPQWIYSYHD